MRGRTAMMALAGAAAIGVAVMAPSALGRDAGPSYGAWAPGIAAPVAATERPSRSVTAPDSLLAAVRDLARATGGDPDRAIETLRMLRGPVGTDQASIYAFKPDGRATCLIVWKRSSTCPTAAESSTPGVLYIVSGGYPAWATADRVEVPSALVGVVADDVRAVTLVEGGVERRLAIEKSAFFAELTTAADSPGWGKLIVEYASGRIATARVPLG